jgi:hypothetical protein
METEGTGRLCCQAAEAERLALRRPTVAGTVIWPFEEYSPERHRCHKTGQISHHRPSLTSWVG